MLVTCALALSAVVVASGCSQPAYRYVAHSSTKTYLKVPRAWKGFDANLLDRAEARALGNAGEPEPSFVDIFFTGALQWRVAYDADPHPHPPHAVSFSIAPVVEVRVRDLTNAERDTVNLASLRNMFFPYDELRAQAEQERATAPFGANPPATNTFRAIDEVPITLADGVRGERLLFEYRQGGQVFVIDQTALLDGKAQRVHVLLIRAAEEQYFQNRKALNEVATSFRVKQKG